MERQHYKTTGGHLEIYKTLDGLIIWQRLSYGHLMTAVVFGLISFVAFVLSCEIFNVYAISITLCTSLLSILLVGANKELTLNETQRTYCFKRFLFKWKIFQRDRNFSEPLFRLYDSDSESMYTSLQGGHDNGDALYQLYLMTSEGYKKVFTFNGMESAYGFRKAILKMDHKFRFER